MITLDDIIGRMSNQNCANCYCETATSDGNSQDATEGMAVEIYGSFCNVLPGISSIAISARNTATGATVWSKVCDTGRICTIPFTSDGGFVCKEYEG